MLRFQSLYNYNLQEYVFKNKQHREHVHNGRNLAPLLAGEVDNDVGDNSYRNTLGNAVKQGHCNYAEVGGDLGGVILVGKLGLYVCVLLLQLK